MTGHGSPGGFLRTLAAFLLAVLSAPAPVVPAAAAADAPHPSLAALEGRGGWKPVEPPRTFGPDTLYEEIDGEAELFLPYGMERLTVALLRRSAAPAPELRLELFRMASPRDAYGIFSQHRYPDQEVVRVGTSEVAVSDTTADFFLGETFVRIRAKPGEESGRQVIDLARDVASTLPGDGASPAEAEILDRFEGRIAGSIIYQKRAMFGYECLSPGFEARFSRASASGRLALLPPAPGKEDERWTRLARELPGYREVAPALSRADLPAGALWIFRAGSCIVAVAGPLLQEQAASLLSSVAKAAEGVCGPSRQGRKEFRPEWGNVLLPPEFRDISWGKMAR